MPKISDLPAASSITGTELIVCVQGGVTKQTTCADIAATAAGGPHWPTPAGGQLQWNASPGSGTTYFIRLDDTGFLYESFTAGSAIHWRDASAVDCVINGHGGGVFFYTIDNGWVFNVAIVAGGQHNWFSATNIYTEAGYASTSRQYIPSTPGNWGGPGVPADLETAIDRIAQVVSLAGTSPIP